jgi:hypothetical protein
MSVSYASRCAILLAASRIKPATTLHADFHLHLTFLHFVWKRAKPTIQGAANQVNEVEETIKMLKANEGFHSYLIVKNDGIVIKYEKMNYDEAKQWAYNVLDLVQSTAKYVKQLLNPDEVHKYEII